MIPKFRAWIKTEKRMIETYNLLDIDFENEVIMTQKVYFENGLPVDRDLDNFVFKEIELMQSTGLKDKNGKEIFEGDILTYGHTTGDIKNHQTLGFYMVDDEGIERFFSDNASLEDFDEDMKYASEILEIIGNIYENPELLEVE